MLPFVIFWQTPHMEQELLTLPEHLSSPTVFSGVHDAQSLVFCVMYCRSLFILHSFFFLAIVLCVLLRFMAPDYLPLVSSNLCYGCYTVVSLLLGHSFYNENDRSGSRGGTWRPPPLKLVKI